MGVMDEMAYFSSHRMPVRTAPGMAMGVSVEASFPEIPGGNPVCKDPSSSRIKDFILNSEVEELHEEFLVQGLASVRDQPFGTVADCIILALRIPAERTL